jgi:hypothetical protein
MLTLPLEQMTVKEKLQAMEELWSDLSCNQNQIPVPQWHKDILDRREKLIKEGKATFVDWETEKKRIAYIISLKYIFFIMRKIILLMGKFSLCIKRPGLEYISWIAFTRTLSSLCCMPEYIGSSTKIIGGCCRKDSLSQFIIPFQEIR